MADFAQALKLTLEAEGGWVHDVRDPGGETYRGLTRRDHPGWPGWPIIDERRRQGGEWRASLEHELGVLVTQAYRPYWDLTGGDAVPDQALAEAVFDAGVNMGPGTACLMLQQALNALNRNGRSWPDLVEDASMGPRTRAAVIACCAGGDAALLRKLFTHLRGAKYVALMRKTPSLEVFARGWLGRM